MVPKGATHYTSCPLEGVIYRKYDANYGWMWYNENNNSWGSILCPLSKHYTEIVGGDNE